MVFLVIESDRCLVVSFVSYVWQFSESIGRVDGNG